MSDPSPSTSALTETTAALADATTTTPTYRSRPTRKQVTQERLRALLEAAKPRNSSGGIYNIWHENFSGGDRNEKKGLERAETRCNIARDAGYTKADLATRRSTSSTGAAKAPENDGAYCCLFFARGCCPNGSECTYLHRLPRPTEFNDQGRDIFGRPKFGDYREDMGGVGSMTRVNRTLYVGRIHEEGSGISQGGAANTSSSLSWRDNGRTLRGGSNAHDQNRRHTIHGPRQPYVQSDTEKVIRRHFGEWGEIERVKVLAGRACAFVTYRYEQSAQFAKEAMYQQKLDHNEIINVRWSTDDPNPGAQKRNERQLRQQGESAIVANMRNDTVEAQEALRRLEGTEAQEGDMPDAKRRRLRQEAEQEAAYEQEMKRLDEENERGWQEIKREREEAARKAAAAAAAAATATASLPSTTIGGLINAGMLGDLQTLSALRKQQQQQQQQQQATKTAAPTGLGSLAAYGSDSEEEGDE